MSLPRDIPARAIRTMAERARRLRAIMLNRSASSVRIAKALRLRVKTVQEWREGCEPVPGNYFEVIRAADRRCEEYEPGDNRDFVDYLPIFARAARLPGFDVA